MKGDPKVIDYLNKALRHELTAVNQYWLHYRLLDNWGYKALAKQWRKESIEEMQHADKLIERIIFLDGLPNMQTLESLHIDFLETQLDLVAKLGLELYVQHHIGEMGENGEE
jgi:bacterioferritin